MKCRFPGARAVVLAENGDGIDWIEGESRIAGWKEPYLAQPDRPLGAFGATLPDAIVRVELYAPLDGADASAASSDFPAILTRKTADGATLSLPGICSEFTG